MKLLLIFTTLFFTLSLKSQPVIKIDPDLPVRKLHFIAPIKNVPDKDGYLNLVNQLKKQAGSNADPGNISKWDNILQQSKNKAAGSNLAMVNMMQGKSLWLSIYIAAWRALQDPADAVTANNLGAICKQLKSYTQSLQCLLYAEKLQPKSLLIKV